MTSGSLGDVFGRKRVFQHRPAGSILIALTLAPLVQALSKGSAWGWVSAAAIGCLALGIASGIGFVMVERPVPVPTMDLALLRNRVPVGSTIAILIRAGTINALTYRTFLLPLVAVAVGESSPTARPSASSRPRLWLPVSWPRPGSWPR